ncbi:MAG: PAS domain-containing protein [bacterium]|nr:PAS domain-containing protein [bacterium]
MNSIKKNIMHDTILDSIADGVFTVDNNWRVTSFNRAAQEITGVTREEAIGQKCHDVFRADICQGACALRSTIEGGRELIDHRVNIVNNNGETIPISISTAVLRDNKGNVIGGAETFRDLSAIELLRKEINGKYTFSDIVGKSYEILRIFDILPDIAASGSTVLIEGPSGSGKELFAKAIHDMSERREKPYVVVNCGALPDTLLESELFGYVKGAFTDAKKDKLGRFARAEGGTIFLDEIGDVSPLVQVKLLRVIQEMEYEPLGATSVVKADVRIIAASNKNLQKQIEEDKFRKDLYYRLNVIKLELPPLSGRRQDIPLLIDHFILKYNAKTGKTILSVSDITLDILMRHDFPGNIRELENIIEHAFVLCRGKIIELEHLPQEYQKMLPVATLENYPEKDNPMDKAEYNVVLDALRKNNGDRQKTAETLGLHKTTLWRKMKKFNIIYPVK